MPLHELLDACPIGRQLAKKGNGAHMTVRTFVRCLCALGLLLIANAVAPQAGFAALAGCLVRVPGSATAE
jgi:hypothetical protein